MAFHNAKGLPARGLLGPVLAAVAFGAVLCGCRSPHPAAPAAGTSTTKTTHSAAPVVPIQPLSARPAQKSQPATSDQCPATNPNAPVAPTDILVTYGLTRATRYTLGPELTQLAARRGIETVVEVAPGLSVGDLPTALAAHAHVGRPDFRLLIDTMHLVRSGSGAADLAAVDPARIGYAQLCDAPLRASFDNYVEEAMFERMVPGEGELPLGDILSALPPDVVVELEVPRRSMALAGVGPIDRLAPCVEAARRILAKIPSGRED